SGFMQSEVPRNLPSDLQSLSRTPSPQHHIRRPSPLPVGPPLPHHTAAVTSTSSSSFGFPATRGTHISGSPGLHGIPPPPFHPGPSLGGSRTFPFARGANLG
ncbi:hypothetical protein Pcinc_033730, partial [Petrolisthes cinctipes]